MFFSKIDSVSARCLALTLLLAILTSVTSPAVAAYHDSSDENGENERPYILKPSRNPGPRMPPRFKRERVKPPTVRDGSRGNIYESRLERELYREGKFKQDNMLGWLAWIGVAQTPIPPLGYEDGGSQSWEGSSSGTPGATTNTYSGNRLTEVPLVGWSSSGESFVDLRLYHNSADAFHGGLLQNLHGLGAGWKFSYDVILRNGDGGTPSPNSMVRIEFEDGSVNRFDHNGTAYVAGPGLFDSLTVDTIPNPNPPGPPIVTAWKLDRVDGSFYTFNPAGYLVSVADRFGNQIDITRNSSNRITQISDDGTGTSTPRVISINYGTNQVDVTDPLGRVWSLKQSGNLLEKIEHPILAGQSVPAARTFNYGTRGEIVAQIDEENNTWTTEYDGSGRVLREISPDQRVVEYGYGAPTATATTIYQRKRLNPGVFGPVLATSIHLYDTQGRIVEEVDEEGYVTTFGSYNSENQPEEVISAGGYPTYLTYNASNGFVATESNYLAQTSTYTYTSNHQLQTYQDPNAKVWEFIYGGSGQPAEALTKVKDPLFSAAGSHRNNKYVVQSTYDSFGNLLTTTDAGTGSAGHTTTISYGGANPNAFGDPTSVTKPDGSGVRFDYGTASHRNLGKPVSVVQTGSGQPDLEPIQIGYDSWLRATSITQGTAVSTVTFDELNRVIEERNPLQVANALLGFTGYEYFPDGFLKKVTNADSTTERYEYNDLGFIQKVTNARGKIRTYLTDLRGSITRLNKPAGTYEKWSYTGDGDVWAFTYGQGTTEFTTQYEYEVPGRLWYVDYEPGIPGSTYPDTSFTYDATGRMLSMTDGTGTTSYLYNAAGEPTRLTTPQGVMEYTYRPNGAREKLREIISGTTANETVSTYDASGRLATLLKYGETTTFDYDDYGRVEWTKHHAGHYDINGYDNRSRLTSTRVRQTLNGPDLASQVMTYDDANNLKVKVQDGVSTVYDYDNLNQLKEEVRGTFGNSNYFKGEYSYDANGNRTEKKTRVGTAPQVIATYGYDDNDRLTNLNGVTINYDQADRPTNWVLNGQNVQTTWTYDSRLSMISQGLSIWSRYWYNGLGTRVQERFPGPLTNIRRDGIGVTAPVVRTYAGASEVAIKPGISQKVGTTTTYSHPGLKNNEHQSQSASAISASRVYDAWGAVVSSTGAFQGRFGHGGAFGYQSDSTGLQLLGHRYYDPAVGRFLTPDPIKDGRNWFAYCENNPLTAGDPEGLSKLSSLSAPQNVLLAIESFRTASGGASFVSGVYLLKRSQVHFHHLFPTAGGKLNRFWEMLFGKDWKSFIDSFKMRMPIHIHRMIHGYRGGWWNDQWDEFFKANPKASLAQALDHLRKMLKAMGLNKDEIAEVLSRAARGDF